MDYKRIEKEAVTAEILNNAARDAVVKEVEAELHRRKFALMANHSVSTVKEVGRVSIPGHERSVEKTKRASDRKVATANLSSEAVTQIKRDAVEGWLTQFERNHLHHQFAHDDIDAALANEELDPSQVVEHNQQFGPVTAKTMHDSHKHALGELDCAIAAGESILSELADPTTSE